MTVFPRGTLIWQRFKKIPREKRQDSFDPQRVNMFGEDSICVVNLLVILLKIFVGFYYMIDLLRLFQKKTFVLSSEHENQTVATLGTLLVQPMLSCK